MIDSQGNALIAPLFIETNSTYRPPEVRKTSGLVWVGITLLVVFIIFSIIYFTIPAANTTRLTSYVGMVGFLGTSVAVIGFFYNQQQAEANRVQGLNAQREALAQQNSIALTQYFTSNIVDLFPLYKQINPDNAELQAMPDPPPSVKQLGTMTLAGNLIFQGMENIVTRLAISKIPIDSPEYIGYYNSYLKQFKGSAFLRRLWALNYTSYNLYAQAFVKRIEAAIAIP